MASVPLDPIRCQTALLASKSPPPWLVDALVEAARSDTNRDLLISAPETNIHWGRAIVEYERQLGHRRLETRGEAVIALISFFMRHGFRIGGKIRELETIVAGLERIDVQALFPGDSWLQNFVINVMEYVAGETVLTTYPWNITLPVADICNAKCTFCTSWIEGRALIKLEQVDMFAELLGRTAYLGLQGHGEPMAHPQFRELLERLRRYLDPRAILYTITNGYYLPEYREELSSLNLLSYSISLNAATPETHDIVMGLGPEGFSRAISGIEYLVHLRGTAEPDLCIYITMVVTSQNVHEAADFVELGNRLGVTGIWFRSLLPNPNVVEGLNYHTLPPKLHPEFEVHRRRAIEAIASSKVPVQADPDMWDRDIIPAAIRRYVEENPPRIIERSEAVKNRQLRRRVEHLYSADNTKRRGQRRSATGTEISREGGTVLVRTPFGAGAYAVSFKIPAQDASSADRSRRQISISLADTHGRLGVGVQTEEGQWAAQDVLAEGFSGDWQAVVPEGEVASSIIVFNGNSDAISGGRILSVKLISPSTPEGAFDVTSHSLNLDGVIVHNAIDPLEDGLNPLGRVPRFACRAVYYNYYVNEMFFRVNPCCYLTNVPGYEEVRYDVSTNFMELWNSPAMVGLRASLKEGPLFAACRRCPEKW